MAAPLRNVFGQVKNKIDARFIMDTGRIFIANIAKGQLSKAKPIFWAQCSSANSRRQQCRELMCRRISAAIFISSSMNFRVSQATRSPASSQKPGMQLQSDDFASIYRADAGRGERGSIRKCWLAGLRFVSAFEMRKFLPANTALNTLPSNLPNSQIHCVNCSENEARNIRPFTARTMPPLSRFYGGLKHHEPIIEKFGTARGLVEERIRRWLQ